MTNSQATTSRPSLLLSYLRLFRLPNVFTAVAGVTMGFLVVQGSFQLTLGQAISVQLLPAYLCLVGASCLLYTAGMVLNDVYDLEVDRQERPFRPLPAGQISPAWAKWLGYELLLAGVALAWLAGFLGPNSVAISWGSGTVGLTLAVWIVLYDLVLKKTLLGPLAMGACRFLNVLLGMSVALQVSDANWFLSFQAHELLIAGGIGLYIVGVTWFARNETGDSNSGHLSLASGVMMLGVGLLGLFVTFYPEPQKLYLSKEAFWLLLLLLSVTIARRSLATVISPTPERVQSTVKQSIFSLIILDAAVVFVMTGPYFAIGVLALLVPMLLLGRWVYST